MPVIAWLLALAFSQQTPAQSAKARALLENKLPCLGCHAIAGQGGRMGPAFDGLGQRLSVQAVDQLIRNPRPGSIMPRVPMDSTTRALIVGYLRSLPGNARAVPAAPKAPLYLQYCAPCHGQTGKGDGYNARYLPVKPAVHSDARAMSQRSDDMLFDAIASGGYILGRSARMPPYGETLTPAQIRELVRHIRQLCKCQGPAWAR